MYQAVVSAGDQPVLAFWWPIATAVDIAVGFLVARSIFGRHAAVTFLLLLTIASDTIGLILVSQRYPVGNAYPVALLLIVCAVAAAIGLRRSRVAGVWPYVLICGTWSWLGCYWSGVQPALALLPIVPFLPHTARHLNQVADAKLAFAQERAEPQTALIAEKVEHLDTAP